MGLATIVEGGGREMKPPSRTPVYILPVEVLSKLPLALLAELQTLSEAIVNFVTTRVEQSASLFLHFQRQKDIEVIVARSPLLASIKGCCRMPLALRHCRLWVNPSSPSQVEQAAAFLQSLQ